MNLVKLYYHAHQFETEQVIFVFIQIPGSFRIDMDDCGTALIKFLDVYTLFSSSMLFQNAHSPRYT